MQIYQFSQLTGELLGSDRAEKSPLDEDVFLLPAYSTFIPPPAPVPGKQIIFNEGEWHFIDRPESSVPIPPEIVVSPWQFRKALNAEGLRAAVEAAIAAADQDTKDGYEFATEFRRHDPLVITMGTALGKTSAQMDDFFALATTL